MIKALRHKAEIALGAAFFHAIGLGAAAYLRKTRGDKRVRKIKDIDYTGSGLRAHQLDIYLPQPLPETQSLPVVFYVHGGSFVSLSKTSHRGFGTLLARAGFITVVINYRLAPEHRFPAAAVDVAAAYTWVTQNIENYGGDKKRIAIAGESAGANLAAGLTMACHQNRPEPWAQNLSTTCPPPKAWVLGYGIYETQWDAATIETRMGEGQETPTWARNALRALHDDYFEGTGPKKPLADFANPVHMLNDTTLLNRPLPPCYLFVGKKDILMHDSQVFEKVLDGAGVEVESHYVDDVDHAFHGFLWRSAAQECWKNIIEFLEHALKA